MPLYKFGQSDVFFNRVETHPQYTFFFYSGSSYYNNRPRLEGAFVTSTPGVESGHVSLYELNVDRVSGSETNDGDPLTRPNVIYPFIYKDGNSNRFRSVELTELDGRSVLFEEAAEYGDLLTGSYPMSASIVKDYLAEGHVARAAQDVIDAVNDEIITPETDDFGYPVKSSKGSKISALKNTLNNYTYLSHHYAYDSSSYAVVPNEIAPWNKGVQEMGLLSIPSIFYGRQIQKGTVNLKFYVTGTLVGELADEKENGELIQIGPTGSNQSGTVAGVVLYSEGFMLLTGSWDLTEAGTKFGPAHTENYIGQVASSPRWIDFAQTIASGSALHMPSSSFELNFKGTNYVPTVTMLAHARKGHLNFSNNPTYIKYGQTLDPITSSIKFREQTTLEIKNITSSSYKNHSASYRRQTYISKIGIYDEKRNLIGVAKVATPVKKTEGRDFTFKLKLDL